MTKEQSQELKKQGYTIIRNQIDKKWLDIFNDPYNTFYKKILYMITFL